MKSDCVDNHYNGAYDDVVEYPCGQSYAIVRSWWYAKGDGHVGRSLRGGERVEE